MNLGGCVYSGTEMARKITTEWGKVADMTYSWRGVRYTMDSITQARVSTREDV